MASRDLGYSAMVMLPKLFAVREQDIYIVRHVALVAVGLCLAADPCVSGLSSGARPGPYAFVLSTGVNRGQSQCFICATADRPAVVIFARTPSDALGKLVAKLDKAVAEHKAAELRAWVTFLSDDQPGLLGKVPPDPSTMPPFRMRAIEVHRPTGSSHQIVSPYS